MDNICFPYRETCEHEWGCADCSGVRSAGVRMKLRGSDLQEAEVNDLLEHLF
jgi:hypothetical protein